MVIAWVGAGLEEKPLAARVYGRLRINYPPERNK